MKGLRSGVKAAASGMHRTILLSLCVASFLLASCTADGEIDLYGRKLSPSERAECVGKGGTPYIYSLSMQEACVMPPVDLGKQCFKPSDCTEVCGAATMTCQSDKMSGEIIINDSGEVGTLFVE